MREKVDNHSHHKKRLHNFWKKKWVPGRSVDIWISLLITRPEYYYHHSNRSSTKHLIKEGILKLFLERKIDLNQMQRMKDMIDSEDPENVTLAINIMYNLSPKNFERRQKHVRNKN